MELVGALLILTGAVCSCIPAFQKHTDDGNARWYAILLYFCSNIPMACSAVYKEKNFNDVILDVWYLTQWVSIYQFLVSFLFMPALLMPGFGSKDGMTWHEVGDSMKNGFYCYLELEGANVTSHGQTQSCHERGT